MPSINVRAFFAELDARWPSPHIGKISMRLIGSTALMLQADYERGTTDSDVLEGADLDAGTKARLLRFADRGTELHTRHGMYLQIVPGGLPFLPRRPMWHPVGALADLTHFEIMVLDVVDVVVSKLKTFRPKDVDDIVAMVKLGLVPHERLIERFRAASDEFAHEARAAELPGYVENLHQIERDQLEVEETAIELPSWI